MNFFINYLFRKTFDPRNCENPEQLKKINRNYEFYFYKLLFFLKSIRGNLIKAIKRKLDKFNNL